MRFNVDKNKCKGCSLCVRVCPTKTLRMGTELNDYGNTYVECIDQSKCIACCMCATMCPDWAITIHDDRPKQAKN
ncbi:4Fe-4S binding protein [bacterium]|nr:4Fe-4S binding protein [bacterium]